MRRRELDTAVTVSLVGFHLGFSFSEFRENFLCRKMSCKVASASSGGDIKELNFGDKRHYSENETDMRT
jgi:hypothetical protein